MPLHQSLPLAAADQPRDHPNTEAGLLSLFSRLFWRLPFFFFFSSPQVLSSLIDLSDFLHEREGANANPLRRPWPRTAQCARGRRAQRPAGSCLPNGCSAAGARPVPPAPALPPARLRRPRPILREPRLLLTEAEI